MLKINKKIDAFFILLRRKNSKTMALNFLMKLIKNKLTSIMNLSYIFRNIFEIYKKSMGDDLTKYFQNKKEPNHFLYF